MSKDEHAPGSGERTDGTSPRESPGAHYPASPPVQDLQEKPVRLLGKYGLKIPALIAVIVVIFHAGYFLASLTRVDPLNTELGRVERKLSEVQMSASSFETDLKATREKYTELLQQSEVPVLLSPAEGQAVFGQNILFAWDYKHHRPDQRYTLELRRLSMPNTPLFRYNVPNSQQKRMHLELSDKYYGHHFWRVYPGDYQPNTQFTSQKWSGWSSFHTYRNVIDRIKQTRLLRVATNPTYYGVFNVADGQGGHRGFDIDLVNWISEQLAKEMNVSRGIKVVILDRGWDEMFRTIESREADLAASSISRMLSREEKYPRLRFSVGYLTIHQVFIQAHQQEEDNFPDDLKGKKVGAASNSTNLEAAKYLKNRFGFEIRVIESPSYGDLVNQLQQGQIDFGLVDNTATLGYLYGDWLDLYLGDFNRSTFGVDCEEYALAVPYEPDEKQSLLNMINKLLQSSEGKDLLQQLKKRYKIKETKTEAQ